MDRQSEAEQIADQRLSQDGSERYAADDAEVETADRATTEKVGDEAWMLKQARAMFNKSTDYIDANITNTWERNINHFHNQHGPSSKYVGKGYKRSRVFRPKTRSNVKTQEAKILVAMFGSRDLIVVEAQNKRDERQVVSAKINKFILQYRMEERMPWTLTVLGAYQDTKVYGVCITHQYWAYEVDEDITPVTHDDGSPVMGKDDEGNEVPMGSRERIIRRDELCCDLIEPENFRFDPMCDWRDPISSSPYLIYLMPIYAGEALEKMQNKNPKTQKPFWKKHELAAILATRRDSYNRTRQAREGRERIDPSEQQSGNEFAVVWAHMNVQRINGEDYFWWTLGTELVLTDMKPLKEEYPWLNPTERPFAMGYSSVEAHRNYPAGDVEQGAGLQEELNEVANQRMDNVKLVLNKRYFVRRGSQTDLSALMRNVSGGGVMMNDPEKDVKVVDTNDVTGSRYQEQDRLSVEHDELVGSFSQSSVQANKNLNETKHGMESMGSTASLVQDYGTSVFIMTWAEVAISQMLRLIQMYETDETILALAGEDAQLMTKFGTNQIGDELLRKRLSTKIDIGMGNTDPLKRVERLTFGVNQVMALPGMAERIKSEDISNEIWSTLGYRDGGRFFRNEQEQTEYLEQNPQQPPLEHQEKMRELDIRENDNKMRDAREIKKMEMESQNRESDRNNKSEEERKKQAQDEMAKEAEITNKREIEAAKIADKQRSEVLQLVRGGGAS